MGGFVASTFKEELIMLTFQLHYYQWWMHQLEVKQELILEF